MTHKDVGYSGMPSGNPPIVGFAVWPYDYRECPDIVDDVDDIFGYGAVAARLADNTYLLVMENDTRIVPTVQDAENALRAFYALCKEPFPTL